MSKTIRELNQWKDNIMNITMGTVYTEFARAVFNKLGRIDKITSINPDFKCYIKTDGLLPEIVWKMIQYKGIMLTHAPIHPMELEYRFNKNIVRI